MKNRSILISLLVGLLLVWMASCQSATQQSETEEQPAAQGASGKTASRKAARSAAPAVQYVNVTVPADTELAVRLVDGLDTGKTAAGSNFEATLASPLAAQGVVVAPVGSKVTGKVTNVVSSGRLNKPAEISLVLTSLAPTGGRPMEISTDPWATKAESHKKRNLEMIGGGAGVGALVGAIAGGKKGAAIGGAVGAGAGTGTAAATGKKEIVLPPETKLNFKLNAPVTVSVRK
jgi:hypothetical protein